MKTTTVATDTQPRRINDFLKKKEVIMEIKKISDNLIEVGVDPDYNQEYLTCYSCGFDKADVLEMVSFLNSDEDSLNLTRPNRPDLSSIPLEVVRYIESLEYGIEKVDSMCLKHATRCDELHEALDGLLGVLDGEWTHSKRVHAQMDEAKNSLKDKEPVEDGQHEI
ncbi:hypothetical protein [Vibrio phage XM1]|nr:hypothetical protein [Vibrio phage XM1]